MASHAPISEAQSEEDGSSSVDDFDDNPFEVNDKAAKTSALPDKNIWGQVKKLSIQDQVINDTQKQQKFVEKMQRIKKKNDDINLKQKNQLFNAGIDTKSI